MLWLEHYFNSLLWRHPEVFAQCSSVHCPVFESQAKDEKVVDEFESGGWRDHQSGHRERPLDKHAFVSIYINHVYVTCLGSPLCLSANLE